MKTLPLALALASTLSVVAQDSVFTYQGRLNENAAPAHGSYDLRFSLHDLPSGGAQIGDLLSRDNVPVMEGLFLVSLDFGSAAFDGPPRWLQIAVRPDGAGAFVTLSPRQPLDATPYAIRAATASTVTTTGGQPLELQAGALRVLRVEGNSSGAPNVIAGAPVNRVAAGIVGATIAGGGAVNFEGSGQTNQVESDFSTIGGGRNNRIRHTSFYSTISGGRDNRIDDTSYYSSVGGGWSNIVQRASFSSFIGGGRGNVIQADSPDATIAGGVFNVVQNNSPYSTIGGGWANAIRGNANECTIAGGRNNVINSSAFKSTIAGGNFNTIEGSAPYSTIGGGDNNRILTGGLYAVVPGGAGNQAGGRYSFAAGRRARATHDGAFVWGDATDENIGSDAGNSFTVRASGGVRLFSNSGATAGVRLSPNDTAWSTLSDQDVKKNIAPVDGQEILERLAAISIEQWHYNWESDDIAPHIGPMAQSFKASFYPGRDDRHITTLELDGVGLAAIQGLNQKLERQLQEKAEDIGRLLEKVGRISELEARIADLETLLRSIVESRQGDRGKED